MTTPVVRAALSAFVAASLAMLVAGCGDHATRDALAPAANEPVASAAANVVAEESSPASALESAATTAPRTTQRDIVATHAARSIARDPFLPSSSRRVAPASPPRAESRASVSAKPAATSAPPLEASAGALLGVMKRGGDRYALFGERFVAQGETVGGWTIKKIGENRCVLERGGKTKTLKPGEAP